jgi:NACHT domain
MGRFWPPFTGPRRDDETSRQTIRYCPRVEPTAADIAIAKVILPMASRHLAGPAKRMVFGDPDQEAFAHALDAAFEAATREGARAFAEQDVKLDSFTHEARHVLAQVLQRQHPTPAALAEALVSSGTTDFSADERWSRTDRLWTSSDAFLQALRTRLREHRPFLELLADDPEPLDAVRNDYLRWATQQFRYIETTGIGSLARLDLPLQEIYVNVQVANRGSRDAEITRRADSELAELRHRLVEGEIDQIEFEALVDRLGLSELPDRTPDDGARVGPLDPVAAVHQNPKVVVLGDPGSRKTTLLRYLALNHARSLAGVQAARDRLGREPLLPVLVSAGAFARWHDRSDGLRAFLSDAANLPDCPSIERMAELLDVEIRRGRVLVLVDGLDEAGASTSRVELVQAIKTLAASITDQGNRVIVTSRPTGYESESLPDSFHHLVMLDMDDRAISQFLDTYLPEAVRSMADREEAQVKQQAAAAKEELMAAFDTSPGVRRLAANPLLLTALVLVHQSAGQLPGSRIEAYTEIERAMANTWRARRSRSASDQTPC